MAYSEFVDQAHPGGIIGIPDRGLLQLGATLTEGENLQFTGLPFFAPEMFQAVEIAGALRANRLHLGPAQLGRERGDPDVAA